MSAAPTSPASAYGSARPMAVTRADVVHGGFVSWLAFVTLLELTLAVVTIVAVLTSPSPTSTDLQFLPFVLLYGAAIGGGVALIVEVVGMPLAWLVARAMAGVRSIRAHLVVYASLGAVVGLVVVAIFAFLSGNASVWWSPLPLVAATLCAASVVVGWWRASRTARWALTAAAADSGDQIRRIA